ncbi:hypothetical protein AX16_000870 [Volvariella volvacea WC 439]|nr:hypothetical protein AX16_000870 [Volvariella volvacea WC 439]
MSSAHPHPSLDNTFGASLIGAFITCMLYGLTTLQTYLYYAYYPKDRRELKLFDPGDKVLTIWVLDTLHIAFICKSTYYYLVIAPKYTYNPGGIDGRWKQVIGLSSSVHPLAIISLVLSRRGQISVALNVLIAFLVQCFFTKRIFHLSNPSFRWWITTFIAIVVFAHFVFGLETVAFLFIKKEFSKVHEMTLIAATPFALTAVLSDIVIAAALCILLHGSRSGFRKTDTIVTKLIVYSINRCILTSAVAIVEVIVFSTSPERHWYLAIDFVIGKLYANSLLATLNSRHSLRDKMDPTFNAIPVSNIAFEGCGDTPSGTGATHSTLSTPTSSRNLGYKNNNGRAGPIIKLTQIEEVHRDV